MKMYSRDDLMKQNFGDGDDDADEDEDADDEEHFPSKLVHLMDASFYNFKLANISI